MFGLNSLVAISLLGSHGLRAHSLARGFSSIGQTSLSQFMSSWETLSQSFSQCQSAFSQRSSIAVATESVQNLCSSYQKAVEQYNSCEVCATSLSHSNFETQIQKSVALMYSSFNSIMLTGQQNFGAQWSTHFASAFQSMSQFTSFSKQVCSSAGIDLDSTLSHLSLDEGLFKQVGINFDGFSGKTAESSFSNNFGGGIFAASDDHHDQDVSGSFPSGLY